MGFRAVSILYTEDLIIYFSRPLCDVPYITVYKSCCYIRIYVGMGSLKRSGTVGRRYPGCYL